MDISLRKLNLVDLPVLEKWYVEINGKEFTSRYTPKNFNGIDTVKNGEYAWYMIKADEVDCGVVFLEKQDKTSDTVILGIMIGKEEYMGRGIGKKAIHLVINQSKNVLSFNKVYLNVRKNNLRAIKCYTDYGFYITSESEKIVSTGQKVEIFNMILCI